MTRTANYLRFGLAATLLLLLLVRPSQAQVADPPAIVGEKPELFLLGFGELTLHSMSVTGNVAQFESRNPALRDGFASNYRMSMFANGNAVGNFMVNGAAIIDSRIADEYRTFDPSVFRLQMSIESAEPIWDSWRFTGEGLYDPARQWDVGNLDQRLLTQPQESSRLELLMRLQSEKNGLIEAGSLRPSFKNARFTLHQRSVFGLYADLHSERVGAEAVAGKLEGKSFREGTVEGIRADGTSGPYDLTHAPVTRGSESIKIETRDRFDESTVLESRTLIRDVDYNIDYLRGRILLHRPVASETIASDPIYIVITFDYLREDNDDLYGGRAHLSPVDGLSVSGSYLHRNQNDTSSTTVGIEEPENLMAADLNLQLADHTTGYFEIAGSEDANSTEDFTALRLGAKTEVIEDLTLEGSFQRIDDQFNSFTNSDLNPTKNQQRLRLGGKFDLTERQALTASIANNRGLEANGSFNSYAGLRNEDILALGYKNQLVDAFGFGVRYEKRDINDRQNALHEETTRQRYILDLGGTLEDMWFLGEIGYTAGYELDRFRNDLSIGDPDSDKNQLTLSMTSKPSDKTKLELGQRFTLRKDLVDDLYDQGQAASFAKLQYLIGKNLNTYTTWEYQRYSDSLAETQVKLWQDDPNRTRWAGTFALEYLPLDKIKLLAKTGRQLSNRWTIDSTSRQPTERITSDFLMGQLTYFHTHHLSFNAESEFTQTEKEYSIVSQEKIWDLGLRVNWNRDRLNEFTAGLIRRWQLLANNTALTELTPTTYIFLLSGSISVTRDFYARASLKNILLGDPVDNDQTYGQTYTRVEAGYDGRSWYRISLGYERIESDNDANTGFNYTGQGFFVRLSGKL